MATKLKLITRDDIFQKIIGRLNDKEQYHEQLFDCGEYGFCLVWFHHGWINRWFDRAIPLKDLDNGD